MPATKKASTQKKSAPKAAQKSAPTKTKSVKKTTPVATTNPLAAALNKTRPAKTSQVNGSTTSTNAVSWFKSSKLTNLLIAFWIVLILALLYVFKGQFIVATVNGQPIFRSTLIHELERQAGPQTLDNIVLETLVKQEAAAKKVTVSNEDIDAEIKKVEDQLKGQNQNLDQLLSLQGMTRDSLREQMKLQLMVDKLVGMEGTQVSDEEVKKYLDDNKAFLPKDAKQEELMASARKQLEQQKLATKSQEWMKELQNKAKVNNWLFKTTPTLNK